MAAFSFVFLVLVFANLNLLLYASPYHHLISTDGHHKDQSVVIHRFICNATHQCSNTIFTVAAAHHINIECQQLHSCQNLSIASPPPTICNIDCQSPDACIDIEHIQTQCKCHGYCRQTVPINENNLRRALLSGSDDNNFFSNLPNYVYIAIIGGLVFICSILLCVMYCKWRHERNRNREMSERAKRAEPTAEEQKSLSGQDRPQLIVHSSNTKTHTSPQNKQQTLNIIQHDGKRTNTLQLSRSPESVPFSDTSGATGQFAKSPITLNATLTHTPSPDPYIPTSPNLPHSSRSNLQNLAGRPISASHQSTHSNSNIGIDSNISSQQWSSQNSSHVHAATHIIMQPVPSPNTTPQSLTQTQTQTRSNEYVKNIITAHNNKRRGHGYAAGYNQDSLSMSSVSFQPPTVHVRKESITASHRYSGIQMAIKEDTEVNTGNVLVTELVRNVSVERPAEKPDADDVLVYRRRSKKDSFVLNLPDPDHNTHVQPQQQQMEEVSVVVEKPNRSEEMNLSPKMHAQYALNEKRDSHLSIGSIPASIQSIPLDRISVMGPQTSIEPSSADESDGGLALHHYQQHALAEEEEPMFSDTTLSPPQRAVRSAHSKSPVERHQIYNPAHIEYHEYVPNPVRIAYDPYSQQPPANNINHEDIYLHRKVTPQRKGKVQQQPKINQEELAQIFPSNDEEDSNEDRQDKPDEDSEEEEQEHHAENDDAVSDHENEFDKNKAKKKKKKDKKKKKRKKKKKKKRKKKKHRDAIQKEEIEFEPDFPADMEGMAANFQPPQRVMGVSPQELAEQVAKDKQHDYNDPSKASLDVQSTVSSHPAFDAKNLKHFMEQYEFRDQENVDINNRNLANRGPKQKRSMDGTFTGAEYKDDDDESISSGTSNSNEEYSYSTSNEEDYNYNDQMSLASADSYPWHKAIGISPPKRRQFMQSIQEDRMMANEQDVTPIGNEMTPNGFDADNDDDDDDNVTPMGPAVNQQQNVQVKVKEEEEEEEMNEPEYVRHRSVFNEAILNHREFFKAMYDAVYVNQNEDKNIPDLYGHIISFMGRHDRWLHCRLVCKSWNGLVHHKYWIFTEHLSVEQANMLKIGDKVDHRDDAGRFIKSTIIDRNGTELKIHYDGWSSKWDSWCDYAQQLHRFAVVRSISRCPRVRGKHIEEKMFVDVRPSYRHGKNCNWRKGKVRRLDDYSGQIEVIYKYKQKKYLLWVHLDNKNEVDRLGKHTHFMSGNASSSNLGNSSNRLQQPSVAGIDRHSNYSLATTVHDT